MVGVYIQLDTDEWKEISNRHVHKSGNVYVGKEYFENYEVRVYVRQLVK